MPHREHAIEGLKEEVLRRGRYLSGIVEMQQRLLETSSDSLGALNHALAPLGEASRADRVYIFENQRSNDGWNGMTSQVAEWCGLGVEPQIGNADLQDVDLLGMAPRWHGELAAGRPLVRPESDFDDFETAYLVPQGIKTLVVLPLMVDDQWTGFIGFDNCRVEASWSEDEIALLRAAASQIALVMAQRRARRDLAALNASLERRVATRTAELADRNRRLHDALERLQRLQAELIQAEKLSSIGRMVAGAAHELRNPTNFVTHHFRSVAEHAERLKSGLAELIDEDDPDNREVCDWLVEEFSGIERLTSEGLEGLSRVALIVDSLVNFARIERDEVAPFPVRAVMDDALRILAPKWPMASEVTLAVADDHDVYGNRVKIAQVVLNLLDNALYAATEAHGPDGAAVRVLAGVSADEDTMASMTWIEVTDNGSGIDPTVRERVFDPFLTTKPVGKGAGMGLAVSWAIAAEHGGRLEVASTGPSGSTFRLVWPTRGPRRGEL